MRTFRYTTVVFLLVLPSLIFVVSCNTEHVNESSNPEEKSCACHEPTALNAVSIDLPKEFIYDNILGDSIQNRTVFRKRNEFVYLLVRCGACDTVKRSAQQIDELLKPLLRTSVSNEKLYTAKFKGKWYEQMEDGKGSFEYFLSAQGTKKWYVQLYGEGLDSLTIRQVKESISTLEIREKAFKN